jgi:hypothetical protein
MKAEGSDEVKVDEEATKAVDQTATPGRVSYDWSDDDVNTSGTFLSEFKVIWPDDKPEHFPNGDNYIQIEIGAGVDDKA